MVWLKKLVKSRTIKEINKALLTLENDLNKTYKNKVRNVEIQYAIQEAFNQLKTYKKKFLPAKSQLQHLLRDLIQLNLSSKTNEMDSKFNVKIKIQNLLIKELAHHISPHHYRIIVNRTIDSIKKNHSISTLMSIYETIEVGSRIIKDQLKKLKNKKKPAINQIKKIKLLDDLLNNNQLEYTFPSTKTATLRCIDQIDTNHSVTSQDMHDLSNRFRLLNRKISHTFKCTLDDRIFTRKVNTWVANVLKNNFKEKVPSPVRPFHTVKAKLIDLFNQFNP